MNAYWELAKAGFRRYSRYRAAMVSSLFVNTVFGLIRASLLLAAIRVAGGPVGGYTAAQASSYVWLGQALLGPLDVWGSTVTIGDRVKTGDIAVDFSRPVSILGSMLATNYGRAAFELLPRGIPPLVVGALLTGLYVPAHPATYLLGALSLLIATAMCHCYYVVAGLTALWTTENRGFLVVAMVVQQVLCGFVVPITWFPPWLLTLARWSPFPAMFQTTIDLLTERTVGWSALAAVGWQAAWAAGLVALALALLGVGRRKVVIQGG